jgi:hypothetical protein
MTNIYFCPGYTQEELNAAVKNNFDVELQKSIDGNLGCCLEVSGEVSGGIFLWLKSDTISPKFISCLAHESLHAANMILSNAGVRVDVCENDEAQAYLLGWIMKKCLETYKK